eukprot:CAMPEP_0206248400 /NCGR_PEP_ID=MMETSP0047_2-20121206/20351_1 /ASSEMBLY_ACC=CAM_ASM_000192 /TAXON_ID=195065 /ORGANISM="Chroomonas mesostigmatica_cf, Strain CCMP1168" /LENGTH=85 /DNA_ID=CAMNT_0053674045 /DNA_START=257 /DNA_END=514 /DNA_ORIENTATION=-
MAAAQVGICRCNEAIDPRDELRLIEGRLPSRAVFIVRARRESARLKHQARVLARCLLRPSVGRDLFAQVVCAPLTEVWREVAIDD